MNAPAVEDIERSSDAMEKLFSLNMHQWSLVVGRVNFAKTLGVPTSRLARAMSGATPSLELACRLNMICGIGWHTIFTGESAGYAARLVAEADKNRKVSPDAQRVAMAESHARARLKSLVDETGFTESWQGMGIPRATLHNYLLSTRLSLSVIWRMHLLTSVPYSAIITGDVDEDEKELRELVGKKDDYLGRFDDLYEPVVRLVEVCSYSDLSDVAAPYISFLEKLLKTGLSMPQKARLNNILAAYWCYREQPARGAKYVKQQWRILEKAGLRSVPAYLLLSHTVVAGLAGQWEHTKEVAKRILDLTEDPGYVAQAHRVLADAAMSRMEIFEAIRLAREGINITTELAPESKPRLLSLLGLDLAICAWAFGDCPETLARTGWLLDSPSTAVDVRSTVAELEAHARIWLRDAPGTNRAISILAKCGTSMLNAGAFQKKVDIYRLRYLLLKKDSPESLSVKESGKLDSLMEKVARFESGRLESDVQCLWAICMYYGKGETEPLKRVCEAVVSEKGLMFGVPLMALPELFESARNAGFWTDRFEKWCRKMVAKGAHFLNMPGNTTD